MVTTYTKTTVTTLANMDIVNKVYEEIPLRAYIYPNMKLLWNDVMSNANRLVSVHTASLTLRKHALGSRESSFQTCTPGKHEVFRLADWCIPPLNVCSKQVTQRECTDWADVWERTLCSHSLPSLSLPLSLSLFLSPTPSSSCTANTSFHIE